MLESQIGHGHGLSIEEVSIMQNISHDCLESVLMGWVHDFDNLVDNNLTSRSFSVCSLLKNRKIVEITSCFFSSFFRSLMFPRPVRPSGLWIIIPYTLIVKPCFEIESTTDWWQLLNLFLPSVRANFYHSVTSCLRDAV